MLRNLPQNNLRRQETQGGNNMALSFQDKIKPRATTSLSFQDKIKPVVFDEPNYFQRIGQVFKREAGEITGAVKKGASALEKGGGFKAIPSVTRAGLRTVGSVAETAFAPIFEIPLVKKGVEFVGEKLLENEKAKKVIDSATLLAQRYPNRAQDALDIVNIVSLGVAPKVAGVLSKEGRAIGSDLSQAGSRLLTESEASIQRDVVELFNKSIKPTAKKTLTQGEKYQNDILSSLKTIKANVDNLQIEDATGELLSRTPQTINELAQAVDQTKRLVFQEYDNLAREAGKGGATIDARPIANEVLKVAENKALQITNPELVKYAEGWAERLNGLGEIDTQTAQEIIKNLNNSLSAFYRNPTFESATRVSIDAGIANNFRKALDDAIEGATGQEYQALKTQYGSLKSIENDVVRASMRDARKNAKGLLDYTDIFTSGQMLSGIMSLNPAMFTKGAVERGFKEYIKFLNDPNRAVGNMFDLLDTSTVQPLTPQSATFNYLKNPKIGNSIDDVSKSNPLAQEARKYKSAEEFANAVDSQAPKLSLRPESSKATGQAGEVPFTKLYHGTGADFKMFKQPQKGEYGSEAIFLSPSEEGAKYYARSEGSKVMPVFVNKNTRIWDFNNVEDVRVVSDFVRKNGLEKIDPRWQLGTDEWIKRLEKGDYTVVQRPAVMELLRSKGYDGFKNMDWYDTGVDLSVGIFDPKNTLTKSQLTDIWERANKKK